MLDACLDLLLGSSCAVCGAYGRVLCERCAAQLPTSGVIMWPPPTPAGLATPVAVGEYADALKALVNAHKERQQFLSLIHISEPTRRTPISYAVFCLTKK